MQLSALLSRLITAVTLLASGALHANPLIDQLIGTTTDFLEQKVSQHLETSTQSARHTLEVNRLDPRLRLPLCPDDAISAALESPSTPVGRVTVRVTCDSDQVQWRLFVPATVNLFQEVVVANRPLPRQHVISADDIAMRERNLGTLRGGYLLQSDQAVGLRLRRPVSGDEVLAPNQLEQNEAVKRGDKVVIRAANSRVAVRMPGEALESGAVGRQIRVRNTRSNRTLKARVVGPGQVEVAM